ncbi:MAG: DUF2442 domain-containing protein [Gammaproteobacteria bacterium]
MAALATHVSATEDELIVTLSDDRTIAAPIVWFPRLAAASAAQRRRWRLVGAGEGISWPELDEDLSVEGLLAGQSPRRGSSPSGRLASPTRKRPR